MVSLNTVVRVLHGDVQSAGQVDGFVRPACGRCRRVVRLAKPYQGQRVCRRCIAQVRAVPCSRCGAVREPATRDGAGKPLCPRSLSTDPVNQEQCLRCGRCRPVSVRTNDGPICPTCRPLPVLTCAICGTDAPCEISRATGQPWCRACRPRWARCAGCGQSQPIRGGTRAEPLCSACTRAEPGFWKQCPTCGLADRLSDGQCACCVLVEQSWVRRSTPVGPVHDVGDAFDGDQLGADPVGAWDRAVGGLGRALAEPSATRQVDDARTGLR